MSTCIMDGYLGAYVLRALEPAEETAVRAHLSSCSGCRDEAADLQRTVAHLALLSREEVEHALGSPRPRPAVRAGRMRKALVAAAVAAACASGAALALRGEGGAAPAVAVVRGADLATHVSATLTVARRPSGVALHLSMRGVYPDGECYLVVQARDGEREQTADWVASDRGTVDVQATTDIPLTQLKAFDVITAAGERLVRLSMPN